MIGKPKTVEILIEADGTYKVDANGFQDASCEKAINAILQAMGGNVVRQTDKMEMRVPVGRALERRNRVSR